MPTLSSPPWPALSTSALLCLSAVAVLAGANVPVSGLFSLEPPTIRAFELYLANTEARNANGLKQGNFLWIDDLPATERDEAYTKLRAGETHYCPPGVVHWHGAAPKEGGTQFNVSRGGITWLADVTDEEFNAKPVHK